MMTKDNLVRELRNIGLTEGSVIEVHSSLSNLQSCYGGEMYWEILLFDEEYVIRIDVYEHRE